MSTSKITRINAETAKKMLLSTVKNHKKLCVSGVRFPSIPIHCQLAKDVIVPNRNRTTTELLRINEILRCLFMCDLLTIFYHNKVYCLAIYCALCINKVKRCGFLANPPNIMKKRVLSNVLLFASIGCIALGVGFLRSVKPVVKEANAANPELDVNDNIVEVGKYPQTVVKSSSDLFDEIAEKAKGDLVPGKDYEYNGEKYRYYPAIHWTEGGGKYEDGTSVKDGPAFYKFEPIKWHLYNKDTANNKAYLYAAYIMDVQVFQQNIEVDGTYEGHVAGKPDVAANDWEESTAREFLNDDFYNVSFSQSERNFILENSTKANSSGVKVKDKVTLMTEEDYSANKDKSKFLTKASD